MASSSSEPTVVFYKSAHCIHCTTLSGIWDKVVAELKKVNPKLRFFTVVASTMSGAFDDTKIPKDLKRYNKWFPMILLVPGGLWDAAMENLGPTNPVELLEGVQILNGNWKGGGLDHNGKYDIRSPGGFVQWLKDASNNDEFKSAQSKSKHHWLKTSSGSASGTSIRPIITPTVQSNPTAQVNVTPVTTLSRVIGQSGFGEPSTTGVCSMRIISRPR